MHPPNAPGTFAVGMSHTGSRSSHPHGHLPEDQMERCQQLRLAGVQGSMGWVGVGEGNNGGEIGGLSGGPYKL